MNNSAKRWVAELRNTKKPQITGYLQTSSPFHGFDCLGIACELFREELKLTVNNNDPQGNVTYNHSANKLPISVAAHLGLSSQLGGFIIRYKDNDIPKIQHLTLAELNDHDFTFPQIADIIEWEPEGLFEREEDNECTC